MKQFSKSYSAFYRNESTIRDHYEVLIKEIM